MSNVRLLDAGTINKIAAGEVVERPASCVKELVENSIDAGATRIEVEIINGGKSLIRVTDDGSGMNREDVSLAIRRHATSKLSSVNDLQQISTLGFRGEALPTIAAVSKFTIQTRRADNELGTKIKIEGGKNVDLHEIGCKVGTTVIVEDLFFNTPARLKFLKTTATETGKIHDTIVKLSLSRPDISFKLINKNAVLTTPGNGKIIDTLSSIYGVELTDSLLAVKLAEENFKLSGFITKPNFLKTYRHWQTFIVNGRVVSSKIISKAIDESYKSLIPKTGYPLAVLKIDVPQNSIDVNVHPQKTELKFEDDGKIFQLIYRAVREAISEKNAYNPQEHDLKNIAVAPDKPRYEPLNLDDIKPKKIFSPKPDPKIDDKPASFEEFTIFDDELPPPEEPPDFLNETEIFETPPEIPQPKIFDDEPKNFDKSTENLQPLGQINLCYIVAQGGTDLYIVDQHAAHERILFDKLSNYAGTIPAQQLLIHRIFKCDSRETRLLENNLEIFSQLGFTIEPSGENEFRLIEIPLDAADADADSMFREIISALPEDSAAEIDDERRADIAANIRHAVLAITACRAAIKAGQELDLQQMKSLLKDLSKTSHPHTCPHGRPTIIKFSKEDLAKMFKRT